jgi:hypothetical protein
MNTVSTSLAFDPRKGHKINNLIINNAQIGESAKRLARRLESDLNPERGAE